MKAFCIFIFCFSMTYACTDFIVQAKDGSLLNGRTLEFALDLQAKIKVFPRKQKMASQSPDRKKGMEWVSKYGFLGVTGLGMNFSFDGMNEAGLSFGYLWLPGFTEYPPVPKQEMKKALDFIDFGAWALGNFSTVAEVKEALKQVHIWGHPVPPLPGVPPVHAALHDAQGHHLVVEFVGGEVKIYDNPLSVLTNSPPFDWQSINLNNYLNLNALNANAMKQNGVVLSPPGQGSGLVGMPGDWTPPSRFVKMVTLLRFLDMPANAAEGVNLAEHLINTVDIPLGAVQTGDQKEGDYTQWAVIKDLSRKRFYFRSYKDLCLKMIDLKQINFDTNRGSDLPMTAAKGYIDMTSSLSGRETMTVVYKNEFKSWEYNKEAP